MAPNPGALKIARATGRSYGEVRVAINSLVNIGGWKRDDAERHVKKAARGDLTAEMRKILGARYMPW